MTMKKLPIGISSIENIISQNYVYVDKTDMLHKLITTGKYYFLSRPRRFGKSLLLTTLEAIFKGDKELFKNCHMYNTDYDWQKRPVIYFDFSKISARSPHELETELQRVLEETAASYNKSIECPNLRRGLANLVKALADLGPVCCADRRVRQPPVRPTWADRYSRRQPGGAKKFLWHAQRAR